VSISEALDPPKAILLLRGIRDFTAKCRDFEMKKVRKSAEKDSLAVDGVTSEPVSLLNSLLTGNLTGKFADLRRKAGSREAYHTEYGRVLIANPILTEQLIREFSASYQGIIM
jgi:hypothetical protein